MTTRSLSLFNRFRLAAHVFRAAKAAGSDNLHAYAAISTWGSSDIPTSYNYTQAAVQGYMKNEVVYAIISDIAESAGEPTIRVYKNDDELPDHPARHLFTQPNPMMTEFELWETVMLHLMLGGNAFLQKVRSRAGRVVELWPIMPSRMFPLVDDKLRLAAWRYTDNTGATYPLALDDVIHIKYPNPLNPYLGLAPMAVAARAVDRDNKATDFINAFFENTAVPQGLLKLKYQAEQGEADRVRALWKARYGGRQGWYDVAVLDADTEYQQLGLTQQEMGMPDLTDLTETRIAMIFKWPPILIGALSGLKRATYENIKTARKIAWEDTLSPIYNRIIERVNVSLAVDFNFKIAQVPFRWDFSRVIALQDNQADLQEMARLNFLAGGITRNEFRTIMKQPPDPQGDVYLMSLGMIELPQGQKAAPRHTEPGALKAGQLISAWPVEGQGELHRILAQMSRGANVLDATTAR